MQTVMTLQGTVTWQIVISPLDSNLFWNRIEGRGVLVRSDFAVIKQNRILQGGNNKDIHCILYHVSNYKSVPMVAYMAKIMTWCPLSQDG